MNNDIIYGEPLNPRVKEVYLSNNDDYKLIIIFINREKRMFDVEPLLSINAFKPLQNKEIFATVKVAYGTIVWLHDIDYCPDTLYLESIPI